MSETTPEVVDAEIVQSEAVSEAAALGLELPDDEDKAIQLLVEKLAEARDEAGTYLDDLKRVAADFDNYRKRTVREQSQIVDRAAERVVRQLLPVLDTLDAAVSFEPSTDSERQIMSGMLNTREQLLDALEKEGLEVIRTFGERFDPEVHEPVGAGGDNGDLIVARELRRGYKLNGKLMRAALVSLEEEE
jgi:molecular chaperone GrpE